jgi:hypothetical protein
LDLYRPGAAFWNRLRIPVLAPDPARDRRDGLYCPIWAAAFYGAAHLCGNDVNQYVAVSLAGLFGGVGVASLTRLDAPRLRTFSSLAIAGAIGAAFALPFALYAKPSNSVPLSDEAVIRISFALWQAAVGTYVYWIGVANRATSSAA